MKSGIYGLAALDGAPLDPRDRALLFPAGEAGLLAAPGCAMAARDHDQRAIHADGDGDDLCLLLGELHEPAADARRLGLDPGTPPVRLVAAAHDRWGVDASTRLSGEWLLVRWHGAARTLTLLMSECARDDCYFAVASGRIAVAPELTRLADLSWVDDGFDDEMLTRSMARFPLRMGYEGRTILKGVNRLVAATMVTIRAEGVVTQSAAPVPPPPLLDIGFEEAMAQVESLLRTIMRRRLKGAGDVAFLLSGGLDSSLLACLGAEEAGSGQRLHFLTSAAPADSGIADETGWAALVADHLNVPLTRVVPPADVDVYAPTPRMLALWEAPVASPRHYLYRAFEDEAVARGAGSIFDGSFGELTISSPGFYLDSPFKSPRGMARAARDGLRAMAQGRAKALEGQFHVQLAPGLFADLARGARAPVEAPRRLRPGEPFGFEAGRAKAMRQDVAASDPRTRYSLPLRDSRLARLVASFPAGFAVHDGAPRAMIRALLRGRVPDRIALRECKMAFSPTFEPMLRQQAGAARERIAAQREAGAGDWLDLAWLDETLGRVTTSYSLNADQAFRVQSTAIAAEFFRWWRDRKIAPTAA